jgi:hypothetical protein
MRPLLLAALVVGLVLRYGDRAVADDPPRVFLENAIKAMGGEELLGRPFATHFTMRGTVPLGGKETYSLTGEVFIQPNGDYKYALDLNINQAPFNLTMALVGDNGWRSFSDMLEDLDAPNLAELKLGRYYDRVTRLVPLLKDKSFTLASLGESKAKDTPVIGVKVASKGQPDIRLFFDKTSSLLVKTEYRAKTPGQDREMLHESYYSDWRVPDPTAADEQIVKAIKIKTDGPSLVEYLRKKVPVSGDAAKIKQLVEQLNDDSFEVREKATADLIAIGAPALPQLRQAAESTETEVKRRALACLKAIGAQPDEKPAAAVVRLVGWRKPAGAAEVLLDWASRLADDPLGREVRAALAAVAVVNGKPDEVLVKALESKDAERRAAAAAALGKDNGVFEKKPGRRLYLTGIKFPMKAVQLQNGAKMLEREYTDVQFYNRFDDSVFAKPK